jgi:DNA-binding HxlR family transcriptional regulator
LAVDVLAKTPKDAALWIAEHFEVPHISKRKHLTEPKRNIHTVGHETPQGLLIRSGLWAGLSPFTQRLVPVLLEFSEELNKRDRSRSVQLSCRAIYRYVGAESPHALQKGLKELNEIGWLTRENCGAAGPMQEAARYTLTPYSDQLQECANAEKAELKREIEIERQLRKERKRDLVRVARAATAERNDARERCFSGTGNQERP